MAIESSRFTDNEQGIEFKLQDNSVGLIQFVGFMKTGRFWHICGNSGSTAILND